MSNPQVQVHVLWSEYHGYKVASLRDKDHKLILPVCHYLDNLARKHKDNKQIKSAAKSEMEANTYALAAFARFLNGRPIEVTTDKLIEEFRRTVYDQVKANPISRGIENVIRETVNKKLIPIYNLLDESQERGLLPEGTIGWTNCKVRSSLPHLRTSESSLNAQSERKYPACFRGQGEGQSQKGQYFATPEDIEAIESTFWQANSAEIANRNTLMLRLFDFQSWRRSTVAALTIREFTEDAFAQRKNHDEYLITPTNQKGGLAYSFGMKWELAREVRRYIENEEDGREAILKRLGLGEDVAKHALFISTTRGTPLSVAAVGEIFSSAMRAAGAPKGAGSHSIRRKTGNEEAQDEIAYREATNQPVTEEEIAPVVQKKLGHSRAESQRAYRHAKRVLRKKTRVGQLTDQVQSLQLQKDQLQAQVARLNGLVSYLALAFGALTSETVAAPVPKARRPRRQP